MNSMYVAPNGNRCWWLLGKLHRDGGPAVEWASGAKSWYVNNQLHRQGGPAIEFADGRRDQWYQHGRAVPPPQGATP